MTTVTRMEALRCKNGDSYEDGDPENPIHVSVGTFEAYHWGGGGGNHWGGGLGAQSTGPCVCMDGCMYVCMYVCTYIRM